MTIKQVWEVNGKYFDTKAEADLEDIRLQNEKKTKLQKLLDHQVQYMYGPKSLNDVGFWKIEDEGPVDWNASGGPRQLAIFYGEYIEACRYALTLKGFWGYGPGRITRLEIVNDPTKA